MLRIFAGALACFPALALSQSLLWPTNKSIEPSVSSYSSMSLSSYSERLYNDEEGYLERFGYRVEVEQCAEVLSLCAGAQDVAERFEYTQQRSSQALSFDNTTEYAHAFVAGHQRFDLGMSLEGKARLLNTGYFDGYVKASSELGAIWVGQDSVENKNHVSMSVKAEDVEHDITVDQEYYNGLYAGGVVRVFDHDLSYQQQGLLSSEFEWQQWRIQPSGVGLFAAYGTLYEGSARAMQFDGSYQSQYDTLAYSLERKTAELGWRWRDAWLGVYQYKLFMSVEAYLGLKGKDWSTSELDSSIEGVALASVHALTGDAGASIRYNAIRFGRQWQWADVSVTWDNLLGDYRAKANNTSEVRLVLLANQHDSGVDTFRDTVWIPNVTVAYQPNDWRLAYTFQQFLPLGEIYDSLSSKGGASGSTNSGGGAKRSNRQDWHWPQVGGYHQLTLSYQW